MSNIQNENLEERIERIKKRNEELEKKHREAEEDRLMALKDNALVVTKPPKDDDWPREHKYDNLDLAFDQKGLEESEDSNAANMENKTKRDHKKFPEGDGPPPDPVYNFLADAERDGIKAIEERKKMVQEKKEKKFNPNQNNRGAGNSTRGGRSNMINNNNNKARTNQYYNEREKTEENLLGIQKSNDNRWKRDSDKKNIKEDKHNFQPNNRIEKNKGNKSPNHHNYNNYNPSSENMFNKTINQIDNMDGQIPRGNIMVSVSQNENGEVKSVKLTSAPAIGTGRVGPRQISKPQFQIQKEIVNVGSKDNFNKKHHQSSQQYNNHGNNHHFNHQISQKNNPQQYQNHNNYDIRNNKRDNYKNLEMSNNKGNNLNNEDIQQNFKTQYKQSVQDRLKRSLSNNDEINVRSQISNTIIVNN